MTVPSRLLCSETLCAIDERNRVSLPDELADVLLSAEGDLWLVKERPGALSLWPAGAREEDELQQGLDLVQRKMQLGRFQDRTEDLMLLGRLLSTRRTTIKLDGRARVTLPKGFREFLNVEPGGQVCVVGAAVCVEIWNPCAWIEYVEQHIPNFRRLFDELAG